MRCTGICKRMMRLRTVACRHFVHVLLSIRFMVALSRRSGGSQGKKEKKWSADWKLKREEKWVNSLSQLRTSWFARRGFLVTRPMYTQCHGLQYLALKSSTGSKSEVRLLHYNEKIKTQQTPSVLHRPRPCYESFCNRWLSRITRITWCRIRRGYMQNICTCWAAKHARKKPRSWRSPQN